MHPSQGPQDSSYGAEIAPSMATNQVHHLQSFQQLAVPVLQPVGFVDDHTTPGDTAQLRTVRQDHLESSDDGMKLIGPLYHSTLQEQVGMITRERLRWCSGR